MIARCFLLALAFVAYAATYDEQLRGRLRGQVSGDIAATAHIWVDTDGGTCVDNASPVVYDSATACGTIDAAWETAEAGDTIRVRTGTYGERIAAARNGSSGNPITFVPDGGTVTFCGVDLSSNSYVRWIGFTIDTNAGGCSIALGAVVISGTNTHLEFWHNTITDANRGFLRNGVSDRISNSIFIGNVVDLNGLGSGSGMAFSMRGNHNLVAYNEVTEVNPDGFFVDGVGTRWLNNFAHELTETGGGHVDMFQAGSSALGASFLLFESNWWLGTGDQEDEHMTNFSNGQVENCGGTCGDMTEMLFRFNVMHNISGGSLGVNQADDGPITFVRGYHNTTVQPQRTGADQEAAVFMLSAGVTDSYFYNDVNYEAWGTAPNASIVVYQVDNGSVTMDCNHAFDPDGSVTFAANWTNQANEISNVDPEFNGVGSDDFTLASTSDVIGAGCRLTTTSGAGTSQTVTLATNGGGFFRGSNAANLPQYGGALAPGDVISIGGDTCTVSSISGDSVTCAETITWTAGESVFFGTDTTPDLGAYPFKAGGYALSATYSTSGGTATITPNDASLVRYVICFENGIPTAVDNAAPYSCSVGGGAMAIRVYPRFASKTLWVAATPQ